LVIHLKEEQESKKIIAREQEIENLTRSNASSVR